VDPPTCYVEGSREALRHFITQLLALPYGGAAKSALVSLAKRAAGVYLPLTMIELAAPAWIALGSIPAGPAITPPDHAAPDPPGASGWLDVTGMEAIVLALSKDPNAKLTVLLIPKGSGRPTLAAKLATTPAAGASIAAESRVLAELQTRLPAAMAASIPAIVELPAVAPGLALVTTALAGSPMTTRYHAWRHVATEARVRADFGAVETWLASFQGATAGVRRPLDMDGGRTEILRRRFAGDSRTDARLARLAAIHSRLGATATPSTAVHGDFWFGNLLMVGGEISGVIDWEAGTAAGEPVLDLVRFALTYALYLDRHSQKGRDVAGHPGLRAGEWGAGIRFAIDGAGWFPDLVRGFIRDGLARLGADPGSWRDAMLAGLADVAGSADHLDFATHHWDLFGLLTEPATAPPQTA